MYKAVFLNQAKVYELYCKQVASSNLYGFIELSNLQFESDHSLVIDPTEERMREEFGETQTLFLPVHSIVRIEQVKKRGACVIRDQKSGEKVTALPLDRPGRGR